MNIQRFLIAITAVNFALLSFVLAQNSPVVAQPVTPVLRGHALEIVDDQGRVRASIQVQPAGPTAAMPRGDTYPETVILRLIDPKGRPTVKLAASEQGSGLGLLGDTDSTFALLKAEGKNSSLKLTNKDGRQRLIEP